MAEVKGKLVTCDRCGETVFLKTIGDRDMDGGFTKWNEFEPFPEGWDYHLKTGQLCPRCNDEYNNLIKWFMDCGALYTAVKEDVDKHCDAGGLY